MDPEIARRCSVCGASIRQRAAFCPQCGSPIDSQRASEVAETQALTDKPASEKPKSLSDFESAPTMALNQSDIESAPTVALSLAELEAARRKRESNKSKAGRGGSHADNVRGQVEKLRKASHVVLDQAAYDPSVRFLLVAAVFLILFIILLFANRILG